MGHIPQDPLKQIIPPSGTAVCEKLHLKYFVLALGNASLLTEFFKKLALNLQNLFVEICWSKVT